MTIDPEGSKAVVVFAGARDNYQLALALQEQNLLETLVTNVYSARRARERYGIALDPTRVKIEIRALTVFGLMRLWQRWNLTHQSDKFLGARARDLAFQAQAALFAYSYYAFEAFRIGAKQPRQRFLFQLHPHPRSVRRILLEEIERTPSARASLNHEAELALSEVAFQELAEEPHLANGWVAASSYTAQTLAEQGIQRDLIHIVPYGVDLTNYPARINAPMPSQPFTIAFLGSLVQRKGLSDLLDAVRLLKSRHIRVILRGRGFADHDLLKQYSDLPLDVQINRPTAEVVQDLQHSDVFVLPSLAEGFAHVLLQAMSCGLPVITTAHTCGPDVLSEGAHGFIVPIRNPEVIAARLQWGIEHRTALAHMGQQAASKAREYTWPRFRAGIVYAYQAMLNSVEGNNE